MNIFTSDLHFNHRRICDFTPRPWTNEENTIRLIELWNENVRPGDVCWHLGDFAFVKDKEWDFLNHILDQLNGQKRFILGNHDSSRMYQKLKSERNDVVSVDRLREIWIGEKSNKTLLTMCHFPMVTWNLSHRGSIQIHGHEHGRLHNTGKSIDVGLDGAYERLGEWRFWTEQDIIDYASKLALYDPSRRTYEKGDKKEIV